MQSLKSNLQEKVAFLKLKAGDSEAFVFFYDKYVKNIYRYVYLKVSDGDVAQDLTQDIFLKIWQHLVDKKDINSFQAFIFRIARNTVIDYYRRNNKQELPLDYVSEVEDPEVDHHGEVEKKFDLNELYEKIKQLKAEHQEIIYLRFVEDLSITDIAQVMDIEKNGARVILHRALNKLKELI